ncbi:MAG TPA: hypothetical protein VI356_14745 [Myxococcales bacterium]
MAFRIHPVVLAALVGAAACGSSADSSVAGALTTSAIKVSITPSRTAVVVGTSKVFHATVTNTTNTAVTWSVKESNGGSIQVDGTYLAPPSTGIFHAIATSVADGTASATATVQVTLPPPALPAGAVLVYDDAPGGGWQDWSWVRDTLSNTFPVATGTRSIGVFYGPFTGLSFELPGGVAGMGAGTLEFDVNGGSNVAPSINAIVQTAGVWGPEVGVSRFCAGGVIPTNAFTHCSVPLAALQAAGTTFDRVALKEALGKTLAKMEVDEIVILPEAAAPVIQAFAANPASITAGGSATLSASYGGGAGSIDNGVGAIASGGSVSVSPAATTTYTLTVTGPNGQTAKSSVTVTVSAPPPPPPAIQTFSASPATIDAGGSSTLSAVYSGGAGSIDNGVGAIASGATVSVSPAATTTYTLSVNDGAGHVATSSVTVTVVPLPAIQGFTASPASIAAGGSSTLSATYSGGSGSIDNGVGPIASGATVAVSPAATTTYTLTVTSSTGRTAAASVTVAVSAASLPAIQSFSASPTSVSAGGSSTLSALYSGGTGTIDNGVGAIASGASVRVTPAATTTYTLTVADGAGHVATSSVKVTVVPLPAIQSFTASPASIVAGGSDTLAATYTGGTGTVDQAVGALASGATATVRPAATTTYTLSVNDGAGHIATATATVTVTQPVSVAVAPASAALQAGAQQLFTATVANATDTRVTWSVREAGGGTVAADGTYTAPQIAGTFHVVATSVADTSRSATATVTVTATAVADPTVGVLPAYNDAFENWRRAGLLSVGGIPNRTTVCATVNPRGGGLDDFTNIQNAINACPAGQVVQLGAGAFTVKIADLPIRIPTGIVLRGTGNCSGSASPYCQTSITVSDGALAYTGGRCGTDSAHQVTCPNGGPPVVLVAPVSPGYNYSWSQCGNVGGAVGTGCGATPLDADALQGQTKIQVHSTSNFAVGQWVLIDEASGAGWVADPLNSVTGNGSLWASSDWLSSSGGPATGRILWSKAQNKTWDFGPSEFPFQANSTGCWHSYCDRPTAELHLVSSIGAGPCPGVNCTVTFDDPLTVGFRQSGSHNAQVYARLFDNQAGIGTPISFLQNAGVENVSLLRAVNGGLTMEFCANCWVHNVEVGNWYGGGITIEYSARSELNNVYVHHCWDSVNNGGEYPIAIDNASTELLVTNSITNFAGKGMVARAGGAGSVVSYNYVDDTMYDAQSGIGDYWVDMGVNASHYSGPHHVLFEGNWGDNLDSDHTHGNSDYITIFRNQGTGLRTPFNDPSNGKAVNDASGLGFAVGQPYPNAPAPLRAAGPTAYNYWFAFVGNVLGLAGQTTAANGWSYEGDWNGKRMFMLGWNDGPGGQDPFLNGVSGSYIFRHGNYDYVGGAVKWDPGTSNHTLPNSFYLPATPAFFSAGSGYPWPWVTPTGSPQIQAGPAGCGGTCSSLPAKARWEAGTPLAQP